MATFLDTVQDHWKQFAHSPLSNAAVGTMSAGGASAVLGLEGVEESIKLVGSILLLFVSILTIVHLVLEIKIKMKKDKG